MAKSLSSKILAKIVDKTGNGESSVRVAISKIRRDNPSLTLNAAAQVYASQRDFSVMGMLDDEDRANMPTKSASPSAPIFIQKKANGGRVKTQIVSVISYGSTDTFTQRHILEANKAYTAACYTAAFILCRKIFENLVINEILIKKYPEKTKDNRALYYNESQGRFNDFSEIVKTLYTKRIDFPPSAVKPIERLNQKLKPFMQTANDYTHSWYHLCTKKEFDEIGVQEISDLVSTINKVI